MVGELFIASCERSIGGTLRAFELWAFPDTTLNLVVVSEDEHGKDETCFPCGTYQLQSVLEDRKVTLGNGEHTLDLVRKDNFISAEFSGGWRQSLEAEALQEALDRIQIAYGKWTR